MCQEKITNPLHSSGKANTSTRGELIFRDLPFGSSFSRVYTKEGADTTALLYDKGIISLWYQKVVQSYNALTCFDFINDSLVLGTYRFLISETNPSLYIKEFDVIRHLLNLKYGLSDSNTKLWNNNTYKDDQEAWGKAVMMGHLSYRAAWNFSNGYILLLLSGNNYTCHLDMQFIHKDYLTKKETLLKGNIEF